MFVQPAALSIMVKLARHTGEAVKEKVGDTDPSAGRTIGRYTYKKKGKPGVVLLKVMGGNMIIQKALM